jgi:hypothetical protein
MQVNPLAEDDKGALLAADAKLGFDDNAAFRQKELFGMRDDSQIDPREVTGAAALCSCRKVLQGYQHGAHEGSTACRHAQLAGQEA